MKEEDIIKLVDIRIKKLLHEKNINVESTYNMLQERITNQANKLDKEIDRAISMARSNAMGLFQSKNFLWKLEEHISDYIDQNLQVALSKTGLFKVIKEEMNSYIKTNFKSVFETVAQQVLARINLQLDRQLRITRDLVNSTDFELKKFVRSLDTTYDTDQQVLEFIKSQSIKLMGDKFLLRREEEN